MRIVVLALLVAVTGCEGEEDGPCEPRRGLYRMEFRESGQGTCGAISSSVVNLSNSGAPENCSGDQYTSADRCEITTDIVCTEAGGSARMTGNVRWSRDGSLGNGTVGVVVTEPSGRTCRGVYNVTYTRL